MDVTYNVCLARYNLSMFENSQNRRNCNRARRSGDLDVRRHKALREHVTKNTGGWYQSTRRGTRVTPCAGALFVGWALLSESLSSSQLGGIIIIFNFQWSDLTLRSEGHVDRWVPQICLSPGLNYSQNWGLTNLWIYWALYALKTSQTSLHANSWDDSPSPLTTWRTRKPTK